MKLTTEMLTRLIKEEAAKLEHPEDVEAVETEADELADTLGKKIDYVKALKIEENRLAKRIQVIKSRRQKILSDLSR